jgi:hypothetical protein
MSAPTLVQAIGLLKKADRHRTTGVVSRRFHVPVRSQSSFVNRRLAWKNRSGHGKSIARPSNWGKVKEGRSRL